MGPGGRSDKYRRKARLAGVKAQAGDAVRGLPRSDGEGWLAAHELSNLARQLEPHRGKAFDDDHRGTAAGAGCWRRALRFGRPAVFTLRAHGRSRRLHREKRADGGKLRPAVSIGKKAGMADTLEAAGQDVKQEPPDELMGLEAHDLLLGAMRIIAPCKADMRIADGGQPAVRDRDPVGVAAEIGQDLAGSGK